MNLCNKSHRVKLPVTLKATFFQSNLSLSFYCFYVIITAIVSEGPTTQRRETNRKTLNDLLNVKQKFGEKQQLGPRHPKSQDSALIPRTPFVPIFMLNVAFWVPDLSYSQFPCQFVQLYWEVDSQIEKWLFQNAVTSSNKIRANPQNVCPVSQSNLKQNFP